MNIYATAHLKVKIEPKEVIEQLLEKELNGGWVEEDNGEYFYRKEEYRELPVKEKIPKEKYEYIIALQTIKSYL